MPSFAVIGGAGTIGSEIVASLRAAGADVRVFGRHTEPAVDLVSGAGLDTALAGADVVIDAANGSPRHPEPVMVEGACRLGAAAARAGVGHLVLVSIVGIEDVPGRYYRAKLAQEAIVTGGDVPWSIVRSTQFHELVAAGLAAAARLRLRPRSSARLQPVAAREAAALVAEVAREPALRARRTVAGPQVLTVTDLAEQAARDAGFRTLPVALPLPRRLGRALREGRLTCPQPDRRGTITFAQWLGSDG